MITVHILEANLKVLPGKIILLLTEPLTHSLPLPPGQQRSHLRREGREGTLLTCHTRSVLSTAGWASHLSGRVDFRVGRIHVHFSKSPCDTLSIGTPAGTAAFWRAWEWNQHSTSRSPQQTWCRSLAPSPPTVNKNCFGCCPPMSWELRKLS